MVVTHTPIDPSATSSAPRKNRRKVTRKTPRTADTTIRHDTDEEMNDAEASTSNLSPLANTDSIIPTDDGDDELLIDTDPTSLPQASAAPVFPPLAANADKTTLKSETRRIPIPPHRMTPLKKDWVNIFGPLTEILALQVRMNVQRRCVEARVRISPNCRQDLDFNDQQTSKHTKDIGALQKGADFVKAYALGFDVNVRS